MAQEEIIFKVGVDTGDSKTKVDNVGDAFDNVNKKVELTGRSFKELQDELKKVTQELQNLNPTSKEFENLTKKANELKREMKAVGDSMNETNNDTNKSFTSLRKELKDLTIQLQNLDPASKEFEKVAQRAGQIKEQMRGVADAINDADPEVFGGKFQRTAEGIAGAFSAVTGAQALFGQQSEEIEKQMLKVQGAIALTQGISAMKELKNDALELALSIRNNVVKAFTSLTTAEMVNAEATGTMTALQKAYAFAVGTSTGAMKVFRIALAATGIGLAVVAITFLIEKIANFVSNTDSATLAQDKFNASVDRYNKQQEKTRKNVEDSIQYQLDYAKAVGMSEEGQYKLQKEGYEKRERLRKEELENNQIRLTYLKIQRDSALEDENTELVKSINEQITKTKEANNNLIGEKYKLIQEQSILTANYNRTQKEEQQKANDEAKSTRDAEFKRQLDEIHQNNIKKIELENQRIQEQETLENEYYDSLKTQQELEVQAVRDKYFKIIQTTKDNEILLLAQQKELDAIAEKYQEEKDKAETGRLDNIAQQYEDFVTQYTEAVNSAQQNEINAVNEKYFNLIEQAKQYGLDTTELERKRAEEIKAIDTELLDAKRNFVNETSNLLGALAGAAEQGSAIQKTFAIAQLAVDTAKSISSVIAGATAAAAATGPAAPFVLGGYIAAGIATVTSALSSAKKILNAPSPSVQPPQMNRPTNQTQNNATQGTQTNVQAQSTYKVVVVDSDITKMQEKTKKTELISTI